MIATLYIPGQSPRAVDEPEGSEMINGFTNAPGQVPALLGCSPNLVDILASGRDYVVYSVFDSDGEANDNAMEAVSTLTGIQFSPDDDDTCLCGPVLVIENR